MWRGGWAFSAAALGVSALAAAAAAGVELGAGPLLGLDGRPPAGGDMFGGGLVALTAGPFSLQAWGGVMPADESITDPAEPRCDDWRYTYATAYATPTLVLAADGLKPFVGVAYRFSRGTDYSFYYQGPDQPIFHSDAITFRHRVLAVVGVRPPGWEVADARAWLGVGPAFVSRAGYAWSVSAPPENLYHASSRDADWRILEVAAGAQLNPRIVRHVGITLAFEVNGKVAELAGDDWGEEPALALAFFLAPVVYF